MKMTELLGEDFKLPPRPPGFLTKSENLAIEHAVNSHDRLVGLMKDLAEGYLQDRDLPLDIVFDVYRECARELLEDIGEMSE